MKHHNKKNRTKVEWTIPFNERTTLAQHLGAALYEFLSVKLEIAYKEGASGRPRIRMGWIRQETGMSDRTLKKVCRGECDSLATFLRVLCPICKFTTKERFEKFCIILINIIYEWEEEGRRANLSN